MDLNTIANTVIPMLSLLMGVLIALFIGNWEVRIIRKVADPRMRMAYEASEKLEKELKITTYPNVGIFNRDITLDCFKTKFAEIEPRFGEVRKALAEVPDRISLENNHGRAQIVLSAPDSGRREEKKRPAIVLQPSQE